MRAKLLLIALLSNLFVGSCYAAMQNTTQYVLIPNSEDYRFYASSSYATLDAAAEKVALVTRITKTGNITKIGWYDSYSTGMAGETLKISVQGVNATGVPDGSILGSGNAWYNITNPTSATWVEEALQSPLAVTENDLISVVVEYETFVDGLVRVAETAGASSFPYSCDYASAWAKGFQPPSMALVYEGNVTYPQYNIVGTSQEAVNFNSGSTGDEVGFAFSLPYKTRAVGCHLLGRTIANNNFTINLYNSTNVSIASTYIPNATASTETQTYTQMLFMFNTTADINVNQTYRLVITPNSAVDFYLYNMNINNTYHKAATGILPDDYNWTSRTNGGAWSENTTRIARLGLLCKGFDDGVQTGGTSSGGAVNYPMGD